MSGWTEWIRNIEDRLSSIVYKAQGIKSKLLELEAVHLDKFYNE